MNEKTRLLSAPRGCENKSMFKTSKRCYCAFCRSPRVVYKKKHVSLIDGFLALVSALLASFIFWQDVDPRCVVLFAVGLGMTEMFIILRWRLSIACPHCGFDPVLYKKSAEKAALRVKTHMGLRRSDPLSVFSPSLNLPVLVKKTKRPPEAGATR
jgi:hypothetical protein